MGQPNESLREARLRTASRRAPGEPMSRSELASAVSSWLWRETGKRHDLDPHLLAKWERGAVRRPSAPYRAALRAVLDASSDADLGFAPAGSAADQARVELAETVSEPAGSGSGDSGPPADADFVASLHGAIAQFVRMDSLLGSGDVVDAVVRRFRDAQRVLASGRYRVGVERDLEAATAELGEVAGWMLIDARRDDEARLLNSEALMLAQIAGDTSMQWFILSNQALASTHCGRHRESLRIAQSFSDDERLPGRVRALFDVRRARALGSLGATSDAERAFDRARATVDDGISDRDPAWTWWVDEQVVSGHRGLMYARAGDPVRALPYLSESAEGAAQVEDYRWGLYIHRANLFEALLTAGDLAEAERTALEIFPMVGQISSVATEAVLRRAVAGARREVLPSTLSDVLEHIRHRLPPR